MAAENLKSLLGSLKAVERSGDISQRHFGGINDHIDSLDGDNMLTGGSTLDALKEEEKEREIEINLGSILGLILRLILRLMMEL